QLFRAAELADSPLDEPRAALPRPRRRQARPRLDADGGRAHFRAAEMSRRKETGPEVALGVVLTVIFVTLLNLYVPQPPTNNDQWGLIRAASIGAISALLAAGIVRFVRYVRTRSSKESGDSFDG